MLKKSFITSVALSSALILSPLNLSVHAETLLNNSNVTVQQLTQDKISQLKNSVPSLKDMDIQVLQDNQNYRIVSVKKGNNESIVTYNKIDKTFDITELNSNNEVFKTSNPISSANILNSDTLNSNILKSDSINSMNSNYDNADWNMYIDATTGILTALATIPGIDEVAIAAIIIGAVGTSIYCYKEIFSISVDCKKNLIMINNLYEEF